MGATRLRTVSVTQGPIRKLELPPYEMLPPHSEVLDGRQKGAANRQLPGLSCRLHVLHASESHIMGTAVVLWLTSYRGVSVPHAPSVHDDAETARLEEPVSGRSTAVAR